MRTWSALAVLLFLMPSVSAEFGQEINGYPVGEGGLLHDPAVAMSPEALAHVQDVARAYAAEHGLDPAIFGLVDAAGSDYPSLNHVGPATIYPYYPVLAGEIQRLALDHPDKVRLHTAGQSELGLDLTWLEIYDIADEGADDFVPLEEREVVWIDGGHHSNEYSGVYFTLALAQWLLDGTPEDEFAQWVLENRHTWIMPMVNPDGSNAFGRLNANLVNINRNYPVIWNVAGSDPPMNEPGPSPASEVETQVNIEWFDKISPDYYASIHCCGNLWLYPYGAEGYDPLDNATLSRICDEALMDVRDDCGPIWSTIYPAGGSSVDTVYEMEGSAAFGFEMSGRSNLVGPWGEPVTFETVAVQEKESWDAIMHAFANVHLYGGYFQIDDIVSGDEGLSISVTNPGYGPMYNATVTYRYEEGGVVVGEAVIPYLGPGGSTTVFVNGVQHIATMRLDISYEDRIMAAPVDAFHVPIQVTDDGAAEALLSDGSWVLPLNALADAPADRVASPGPGLMIVIGLAALVLVRRR